MQLHTLHDAENFFYVGKVLSATLLNMSRELDISPALLARLIVKEYLCQQNKDIDDEGNFVHIKNGMCLAFF